MARYAEGDDLALHLLFDRLAPRVLSFLRCSRAGAEHADQLLQTTFVQLHRRRRDYPRGSSARTWLFGIAADVQQKKLRKRSWFRQPARETPETHRDPAVREAMAGLPESDRQVLHLHRVEGMSFSEIAQVIGASEDVIRARAIRSYRQLQERLLVLVSAGGRP